MSQKDALVEVSIPTSDGYKLAAIEFRSTAAAPKGRVLICSAVGTPKEYYKRFATWLAERGYEAVAFDYRGYQERGNPAALRALDADLTKIGRRDVTAAIDYQKDQSPDLPLFLVAHSMGAHLMGLATNSDKIDAVTTVASGSGYWRHWPLRKSFRLGLIWFVVAPLLTRLYGYFPAEKLRWTTNMAKGVGLEWSRWARHPDYMLDEQGVSYKSKGGFRHFDRPILSLSFTDDTVMSLSAVEALHALYTASKVTRKHHAPADLGFERIDHFGFFRRSHKALWPLALDGFVPRPPISARQLAQYDRVST